MPTILTDDAERTLGFFGFEARRHGLKECEGRLIAGLPATDMEVFKKLVLQKGDQLPLDQFSAWLAASVAGPWKQGVCKECSVGKPDGTCHLWTLVASYFIELSEIRRYSRDMNASN